MITAPIVIVDARAYQFDVVDVNPRLLVLVLPKRFRIPFVASYVRAQKSGPTTQRAFYRSGRTGAICTATTLVHPLSVAAVVVAIAATRSSSRSTTTGRGVFHALAFCPSLDS